MRTTQIRKEFLDYFQKNAHEIVTSSPLVPHSDPTLLFTNAGMVPFKNVFTGHEACPYVRAASAQKCVRAGGKHNDLENVGYTARHHTFFEMLGNFSFGDYFKEKAIFYVWDLLIKQFQIDKNKLYITYYAEDLEARDLWKKIAMLDDARLIPIATKDNFWSMGDTGPCGPCSEIFYDHGDKVPGGLPGTPDQDGDRYVEIWNLVFMQYNQENGAQVPLPKPSIDTGMGLERIAAVLQGTFDNYKTDIIRSLIEHSASLSHTDPDGPHAASHRVIADHLRAMSFLIADGVLPSNEGRGYVLRRIMRRAMRHAHMIGVQEALLHHLVPPLVLKMSDAYPELTRAQTLIKETIYHEEQRFRETLERGLKLLEEEVSVLHPGHKLSGTIAFKLYDTYGFPLDLTQDVLKSRSILVDDEEFHQEMTRQKEMARASWQGSGEESTAAIWLHLKEKYKETEFLGYHTETSKGKVLAIVHDGQEVQQVGKDALCYVLLDMTSFYAESGGQMGDTGTLTGQNLLCHVEDTVKKADTLHVHKCRVTKGVLAVGCLVEGHVDHKRRSNLRRHHSATHLLDAALRKRFGETLVQKGSLVAPDRLRFDFSHNSALSSEDITWLETEINTQIRLNIPSKTTLMSPQEALKKGAIGLFGEKYGDVVRVVTLGEEKGTPFSLELCGGTHVTATGDIGLFKIVQESSVAAGVRRLEAVVGEAALSLVQQQETYLKPLQRRRGEPVVILFVFQVSGAFPIGTRPLSRRFTTLIGLTLGRLPEFLKYVESLNKSTSQRWHHFPGLPRRPTASSQRRLYEILETICSLTCLKISLKGTTLVVERDLPYFHIYPLSFLSLERQTDSSTSANTSIGFGTPGFLENGSLNNIRGRVLNDFWKEVESNLDLMLRDEKKLHPVFTEMERARIPASGTSLPPPPPQNPQERPYSINKQSGLITVYGTQKQHRVIEGYLEQLEQSSSQQILIEAKIIEVSLEDEYRSGINWETVLKKGVQLTNAKFGDIAKHSALSSTLGGQDMVSVSVEGRNLKGVMNMIESFGSARTLSSPRVTVLNNQTALLKVADNQVFFQLKVQHNDYYPSRPGEAQAFPQTTYSSQIQTVPVGFIMTVQPSIDRKNNQIILALRPTITRVTGTREDPAVKLMARERNKEVDIKSEIPIIATREIDSVLRLKSGQVAILGGLMQEVSANLNGGIPGTNDTPFSFLTRGKSDDYRVVELVIFLKATILPSPTPHASDKKMYEKFYKDPRPLWSNNNKGQENEKQNAKQVASSPHSAP
jgi:alanyl-tRNA synthetase